MWTLKEIVLVKLAVAFFKNFVARRIIFCFKEEIWNENIREETYLDIPLTLQDDIIALIKPIKSEVLDWMEDHRGIFTTAQEMSIELYFNADGTVDRIKTADLFIHSERFDVQTRFVLACQYWSSSDVLDFFKNLHESAREQILHKYSTADENLNKHEKNVVHWIEYYRDGGCIVKSQSSNWCYQYYNWTDASLQSRLLDDLLQEERQYLLDKTFEEANWIHVQRFCFSRMSADHREDLLKRFPLKVLRTYLYWPNQRFFLDFANKVWDRLPGNHFTCLLHIIICQKIVELWKDFDYVNLLREFWYRSPDNLKQCVVETDIFEVLMKILKNGELPMFTTEVEETVYLSEPLIDYEIPNAEFECEIWDSIDYEIWD
ncbi:uncharacterized protein TNCV_1394221 [Trichonephila clavipes]|nr:uncharacterized protein TNCV_1394221 [Trichonephila clavipes]